MIFKDSTLLQEAYISAVQKTVNVPSSTLQPNDVNQDPATLPVGIETSIDSHGSGDLAGCGCGESEEQEEDYMAMSNLFSLFSNAKKIHRFLMSGVSLEPWMQQKIAVCADNLESVMRSVDYDAAKAGICD